MSGEGMAVDVTFSPECKACGSAGVELAGKPIVHARCRDCGGTFEVRPVGGGSISLPPTECDHIFGPSYQETGSGQSILTKQVCDDCGYVNVLSEQRIADPARLDSILSKSGDPPIRVHSPKDIPL